VVTAARLLQGELSVGILLVGMTPLALVPHTLALLLFLAALVRGPGRRWSAAGAVLAAAAVAAHVGWLLPDYLGTNPDAGRTPDLVVAEVNMSHGDADPRTIVAEVRRTHADVLVLPEITAEGLAALHAQGLDRLLPHEAGRPGPGRTGLMAFARVPLTGAAPVPGASHAFRVEVATTTPFTLLAAHAAQPMTRAPQWDRDGRALAAAVRATPGRVVLAGDLNATDDHQLVQRLLDAGLRDAARVANAGWQPTWPGADGIPVLRRVGLGALDHVLVGGGVGVVSTDTTVVAGTDHRMLVARLTTAG
jgi:endonuclease/exonuclease/phosphatase (EEP) superfamily protein YafD